MKSLRAFCVCAVLAIVGLACQDARADYGYGCNFGNLNAYGAGGNLYGSGYLPVPPYFSIHPPVYYSRPYARPYGWSPYAWSGSAQPFYAQPQPRLVMNPHVPAAKPVVKEAKPQTAKAELIHNPYFVKAQPVGEPRLAKAK